MTAPISNSREILRIKRAHPALQQMAYRRKLPTSADDKHYAVLKTPRDNSERVLLIFNMQPNTEPVSVDVSGLIHTRLSSLTSGKTVQWQNPLKLYLPPWGFECLSVDTPKAA